MRIVLIGGSSFFGSRLARRLKRRIDIELSIFNKATSHAFSKIGDICDAQSIDDWGNVFI